MTSIHPPRDDEGVVRRRLQRAGTAPVGRIRRAAPGPALRPPAAQTDEAAAGGHRSSQMRGPERRVQGRRRRRVAVLLDTRSPFGDRRRRTRRGRDRTLPRRVSAASGAPGGALLDDDLYA
jgi:hypothetical protein